MASLTFTVSNHKQSSSWRRRPQKKSQKKPFCKVCFDASKPESLYTNHFLKDRPGPNGKVVCPTLLTTECRYCHEKGHFKSHCSQLVERKRVQNHKAKAQTQQSKLAFEAGSWMTAGNMKQLDEAIVAAKLQPKVSVQKFTSRSAFAALDSSDDEEEVEMSYTRGPSTAVAKAPQGAWATKFSSQTATKPATKPAPACVEVKVFDFKSDPNSKEVIQYMSNRRREAEIVAELAELNAELQEETQKSSGCWADAGDIDDIENKIEELETELASL